MFLDDEFAFGLHQDVLLQSGIAVGDVLEEDQIAALVALEERRAAKEKAIRLLAVRARSRRELDRRLTLAHFSAPAREWAMQELDRLHYLDDLDFAIQFVKTRLITRPQGRFLMRQELAQKGVAEELIDKALQAAYAEIPEADLARQVARKRLRTLGEFQSPKTKKRIFDLLGRRGFAWEIIQDIGENWQGLIDDID